jgi:hypothetical protein
VRIRCLRRTAILSSGQPVWSQDIEAPHYLLQLPFINFWNVTFVRTDTHWWCREVLHRLALFSVCRGGSFVRWLATRSRKSRPSRMSLNLSQGHFKITGRIVTAIQASRAQEFSLRSDCMGKKQKANKNWQTKCQPNQP